jgi:hypothetical protein
MAIPPPESAAARTRDDVRVPRARRRRLTLLALAVGEIVVIAALFGITLATEANASDAFGHAHSQVLLMVSLIAVPGGLVRLFALLLARAALFSALLTAAVCARAIWIVLAGVVLSVIGQVICLFNAGSLVPEAMRAAETDRLVVAVMWSSAVVITWALVAGALQCVVIHAARIAAVKATNGGHARAIRHSLTEP